MPYAACSRSHHPAPTPTNARPPDRASRVAAALAVIPAGRKVTGVTSVPSRSRVSSPATRPSVTHGSAIGSQARSTCGIWIRWSISASPANPASSAASAIERSQPAGSSPHGKRESWSITARPCEERRSSVGAATGAGVSAARGGVGDDHVDQVPALLVQLGADLAEPLELRGQRRRRDDVRAVGVAAAGLLGRGVDDDGDGGQAGGLRRLQPGAAAAAVEAEGVDDGGQPAREAGRDDALEDLERLGGRVEVVGSGTDHAAQVVGRHDLGASEVRPGEMRLARPRGSDEDQECGIGQVLHTTECVRRRRSCRGRGWRGPSRAGPGRGG